MFERFSDDSRRVVVLAQEEARGLRHDHIGTEHLLLGLLRIGTGQAAACLSAAGVSVDAARQKVAEAVAAGEGDGGPQLPFTARAKRALDRANRFSLQGRDGLIEPEHVLRALLDVEGTAGQVLRGLGVDLNRLGAALRAEVGSASATAVAPEPEPEPVGVGPACPSCRSDLDRAVAYRSVIASAADASDDGRPFVVAFCATCGTTLGVTPA